MMPAAARTHTRYSSRACPILRHKSPRSANKWIRSVIEHEKHAVIRCADKRRPARNPSRVEFHFPLRAEPSERSLRGTAGR